MENIEQGPGPLEANATGSVETVFPDKNVGGYIALVREVFGLHQDQEIVRRDLVSKHLLEAGYRRNNPNFTAFPDPTKEQILEGVNKERRNRLDSLTHNPTKVQQLIETVDELLDTLFDRERKMLILRFQLRQPGADGWTFREVAKEFGLKSREGSRRVIAKSFRKLRHPSRSKYLIRVLDND